MLRTPQLVLGTALSLATSSAWADDCPERLDPTPFRERLRAIVDGGLGQAPGPDGLGAIEQLDALERLAVGCIDGPVFTVDMGTLYLSRGMFELNREGGDLLMGRERLAWAAALGGDDIWSVAFATLRPEYERALEVAATIAPATLALDFAEVPDVMVLDGQVEYDLGPREVNAGAHLIQWLGADGWTAARVVIESGGYQSAPRRGRGEASGDVAPPKELAPAPESWVEVAAAGMYYRGQISDGLQIWEGASGAPTGRVAARWSFLDVGDAVSLIAGGALAVGQSSSADRPGLGTRLVAEAGAAIGGDARVELLVGFVAGSLPMAVVAEDSSVQPGFEGDIAAGPGARLRGAVGNPWRLDADLSGAKLGDAWETSALLGLERIAEPVGPMVRLGIGQLSLPGLAGEQDQYIWVIGEVGARWYF